MKNEFPNIREGAPVDELYTPAIEIAKAGDTIKAGRYFAALVENCLAAKGIDETEAKRIVSSNIGYWAGYFERGTIEKVYEVFGCAHPVFGISTPDSGEAFRMGVEMGKRTIPTVKLEDTEPLVETSLHGYDKDVAESRQNLKNKP
jgi:hypothetical protein